MGSYILSRRSLLKSSVIGAAALAAPLGAASAADRLAGNQPADYFSGVVKTQTWCEMCFWNCGVTALSKNGRVYKLEGQPKCPNNYGSLCARGNSGVFLLYDPDRLKYPLIRDGERGSGKFRRVSWDEAASYIAEKLKMIIDVEGPRAVSMIAHGSGQDAFVDHFRMMGAKNIAIPSYSQCLGSRELAWYATYGATFTGREAFDGAGAKAMMFLGRNVLEAVQVGEAKRVTDGLDKGAKLIYVDPRYSKTAAKADYWLKIKPGTDMALVLGMIAHIIQNGLYDKAFIEDYTYGMDEMKEFYKDLTLDWAAAETGIKKESILEVTEVLLKAAPNCFIHPGRRVSRYGDDTQMIRAIAILNALMGNWQMPGGLTTMPSLNVRMPRMAVYEAPEADYERADGVGNSFPLTPANMGLTNKLMEAIHSGKPYPVKALFIYDVNPFHHGSDDEYVKEALGKLDLMVTCDLYITDAALYSDVILPEASYLERADPIKAQSFMIPFLQYREAASAPVGDLLNAWDMAETIGKKMGLQAEWLKIDDYNARVLEKTGITMDLLKEDGVYADESYKEYAYGRANGHEPEFETPYGVVELYSSLLADYGFSAFPEYTKHEQPKDDEFRLLFGRLSFHTHAKTQNLRPLLALQNYRVDMWIPAGKAQKMGIRTGDKVRITKGPKRSSEMTAFVTDMMDESCVFIPHGFGRQSKFMKSAYAMKGASDANFVSNVTDPVSGAAGFHCAFVKVEKV